MKLLTKILLPIGLAVVIIQFIRPARNKDEQGFENDISKVMSIPDSVQTILKNACYDCHSNNTVYPWYSNIQPVGWFLARDIKLAKENLNFSEFGTYNQRRRSGKLNAIADEINENAMPLPSYRLMHKDARLLPAEKRLLISWAENSTAGPVEK